MPFTIGGAFCGVLMFVGMLSIVERRGGWLLLIPSTIGFIVCLFREGKRDWS